jgi:hypothetical protein
MSNPTRNEEHTHLKGILYSVVNLTEKGQNFYFKTTEHSWKKSDMPTYMKIYLMLINQRTDIIKMAVFLRLFYRFNVVPTKILAGFYF